MKHRKTITQLRNTCNSKAPIDDTVVRRWKDIVDSLANQWPLATIAETLRAEGEHVGNDKNTGFTTAVKRVAKRKGVDLDLVKAGDPAAIAKAVIPVTEVDGPASRVSSLHAAPSADHLPTIPTSNVELVGRQDEELPGKEEAQNPARPSFGDNRYPSDF